MTQATLLRSVSLRDDLAVPARLAHYRPTRRSLPVTRAVLEGDATMVIAAYGSGKSLAAGIGALCIANDSGTYRTLNPVLRRLRRVDPSLPSHNFSPTVMKARGEREIQNAGRAQPARVSPDCECGGWTRSVSRRHSGRSGGCRSRLQHLQHLVAMARPVRSRRTRGLEIS